MASSPVSGAADLAAALASPRAGGFAEEKGELDLAAELGLYVSQNAPRQAPQYYLEEGQSEVMLGRARPHRHPPPFRRR